MVQVLISFDLLPGVDREYREFVTKIGVPFWKRQPGLTRISGFRNLLGGQPQIFSQMECLDAEAALRILTSPEYQDIVSQQARFVTNRSVYLLEPSGRTPAAEGE